MKFHSMICTVVLFSWLSGSSGIKAIAQEQPCQKAPDFVLPDLQGKDVRLSDWIGKKIIILNFWATWCTPCLEELKAMIPIYEKYQKRGLEMLCISVDDNKTVGRVPAFVNTRRYPYMILLDTNNEVMRLLDVTVPPFTAILDRNGCMIYRHTGYRKGDEKTLASYLEKLLPEKIETEQE